MGDLHHIIGMAALGAGVISLWLLLAPAVDPPRMVEAVILAAASVGWARLADL